MESFEKKVLTAGKCMLSYLCSVLLSPIGPSIFLEACMGKCGIAEFLSVDDWKL